MITKRARLWLSRGIALAVMIVVVVVAAATWFYAGRIESELLTVVDPAPAVDLVVLAVGPSSVTLPANQQTTAPGTWALHYEGGDAVVGDVIATAGGTVTRELRSASGRLAGGTAVAFDRIVFGSDPGDQHIPFEEVLVPGPLGDYPAWLVPGSGTTWAILVHDRGTDRREALRLIPTLRGLGLTSLTITYRNDAGAPAARGGHIGMGRNEWDDLAAAVDYAVADGATGVVLIGYGVGGSIVEVFMDHSRQAGRVSGIVLDSPLLDPAAETDRFAADDKVPGFIVGWAKAVATLRFGVDWEDLNHVARAAATDVPTLIIHGEADDRYPLDSSRRFAEAAPYYVTLVTVPGAGHGASWNAAPDDYRQAVIGFVTDSLAPPEDAGSG